MVFGLFLLGCFEADLVTKTLQKRCKNGGEVRSQNQKSEFKRNYQRKCEGWMWRRPFWFPVIGVTWNSSNADVALSVKQKVESPHFRQML